MKRSRQSGYALLTVVFLCAVMLITSAVVVPDLLTQGRREKEEETIWRGEQYARAVKLFYRKNGRFPQSLEQLTKPQNNIRFMRQAYKDPMNAEDGAWRLIYVGPGGQLIGSVTRTNALLRLPGSQQSSATSVGGPLGGSTGGGPPRQDVPGVTVPASTGTSSTFSGPATSSSGSGQVFGGNIIGVGSKIPQSSIRVYNGGQTYREWEFIWDPVKDAVVLGQPGQGRPPGTQPGTPVTPPRRP